jgi:hypothetical protein
MGGGTEILENYFGGIYPIQLFLSSTQKPIYICSEYC